MLQTKELKHILQENAKILASLVVMEQAHEKSLLPKAAQQKKVEYEIEEHVKKLQHKFHDGLLQCVQALDLCNHLPLTKEKVIDELTSRLASLETADDLARLGQGLLDNISWKEQLGITDECIMSLYQGAKALFENKNFEHAENAFMMICSFDPTQYSIWVGLGHSSFQLHHPEQAINAYSMASGIDSENVWPHIWIANCYEQMKDTVAMKEALANALSLLKSKGAQDPNFASSIEARIKQLS